MDVAVTGAAIGGTAGVVAVVAVAALAAPATTACPLEEELEELDK